MEKEREEIINKIIKERLVETCVQYRMNKCKSQYLKEEMVSETYLWLCNYDLSKLSDASNNNHLSALITAYIIRQWFSHTSDFYKKYKRFDERTDEITEKELNLPEL